MRVRSSFWVPVAGAFLIAGCGGDTTPDTEMMEDSETAEPMEETMDEPMEPGTVSIVQPQDGAEVTGPNVEVVMEATGIDIVESGIMEPGTGHHHIFLDVDVTPMDEPIPSGLPGMIHKGDGTSTHMLEGVAPGEHRLIAVVADGAHIPLDPPVMDTIHFTVVEEGGQD